MSSISPHSLLYQELVAALHGCLPAYAVGPTLWALGWNDGYPKGLRAAAQMCGRSHECVRIWKMAAEQHVAHLSTELSQAIRITLEPHLPMSLHEAGTRLKAAGITGALSNLGVVWVLRRAQAQWCTIGHEAICGVDQEIRLSQARQELLHRLHPWGVSNLCADPAVQAVAQGTPHVRVGAHGIWKVRLPAVLLRRISRALSVHDGLPVSDLVQVLVRDPRPAIPPSGAALYEALQTSSLFLVTDGVVCLGKALPVHPTPVEAHILALLDTGPRLGQDIVARLHPQISSTTLRLTLQCSSVVVRVRRGVYGRIGSRVIPVSTDTFNSKDPLISKLL